MEAEQEFNGLLTECRDRMVRHAYSMVADWNDAEDIVQEASVRAWGAFGRFDRSRSFPNWFARIVRNEARRGKPGQTDNSVSLEELLAAGWDIADTEEVVHF